ncbi:hypothetical protein [Sphaerisporangium perillae]|uniref:hypothetical protein n=1 Tax=Sphaerisporangium perillae TaxID=2935860 RepID=UPI00200E0612|nr:hypothetical protein [Sphaerisporangium perillae]
MRDSRARLRYLDEVITVLYPSPPPAAAPYPRAAYALVPSRFVPRRLVPRSRWLPGRRRLPRWTGTIEAYLGEVFGQRVTATIRVRPARRANRKPVLELRGASGGLLAFVKIGDTDRSRALVRHESATLELLAGTPMKVVSAPTVLHHGQWNGLDVLALSPLPTRRGRVSHVLLGSAVREIAALATAAPGGGSAAAWPGDHPGLGGAGGRHYAWHGDFSPWNMAPAPDGRLSVWDWERFATGVPLGFDALHHFFQRALRRMPPRLAAEACLAQAVRTLAPFGPSAGEARETAVHYLITLADRYERDGHQPLGPPSEWLNPLVDHQEVLP